MIIVDDDGFMHDVIPRKDVEQIKSECWNAGMNMTDEYQGVWVRFRDIEKIVNKVLEDGKA